VRTRTDDVLRKGCVLLSVFSLRRHNQQDATGDCRLSGVRPSVHASESTGAKCANILAVALRHRTVSPQSISAPVRMIPPRERIEIDATSPRGYGGGHTARATKHTLPVPLPLLWLLIATGATSDSQYDTTLQHVLTERCSGGQTHPTGSPHTRPRTPSNNLLDLDYCHTLSLRGILSRSNADLLARSALLPSC